MNYEERPIDDAHRGEIHKYYDVEEFKKFLEQRFRNTRQRCLVCGGEEWDLQGRVYQLVEYDPMNTFSRGSTCVPVIPIYCNTCGNTILISALYYEALKRQGGL